VTRCRHDGNGFRPIPLGILRRKRKKRKKKKEIIGNHVYFLSSLVFNLCFCDKIIISVSVHYILLYQALIPEPPALLTCAVQFFPLSTPLHPLTCPHFLQGTVHTSGQCKILLLPGQFTLRHHQHFLIVSCFRSFVTCRHLLCISV
jgi:hypothetical protein